MGVIVMAALALAALRSPTSGVARVTRAVAIFATLTATVAALVDRRRVFWLGFAVFGGGVLIFGALFSVENYYGVVLALLLEIVSLRWSADSESLSIDLNSRDAVAICDSVLSLATGFIGGFIAVVLRPRDDGSVRQP